MPPRILLDLPPDLADTLFDETQRARLATLGDVIAPAEQVPDGDRPSFDVVVTGWGSAPFATPLPTACPLQLVAHSAGTIRPFVPPERLAEGLRVTQAAAGMAVSVAECAVFMTLSLLRDLHRVDRLMQRRDWAAAQAFPLGDTIVGSRIGVVGASRVGRAYLEQVRALGAEVVLYDPFVMPDDAASLGVSLAPSLGDLARSVRVLAIHAPVTDQTRRMISAEVLAALPDGAAVINTARAAVVDGAALLAELATGRLSAALDVFDTEPLPPDSPLWDLPNVLLTPHLGAATRHSRRAQGTIVVDEVERFLTGRPLQFEITRESYDRLA